MPLMFTSCVPGSVSKAGSSSGAWLTLIVCIVLLASCESSGSTQPAGKIISRPIATSGCNTPAPTHAGITLNQMITSGGLSRGYRLHLPSGYSPKRPQALILAFHGESAAARDLEQSIGLSHLSDQEDFIAVYPQGTGNPPAWASGGAHDPPANDVLFVSELLTHLQTTLCIDARRIYTVGYSNGGGLVNVLACTLARRIAAFASVSGAFYPSPGGCHPGRAVPILEFHGTGDSVVPYLGGAQRAWEAIPVWLRHWAQLDGCSSGPTIFMRTTDVQGEQWTGCTAGGTVVHYRIEGGDHDLTTQTINILAIIWKFFVAHPLLSA
ncbi:MAG: ferulic acid esterase [Chloroflexota bacterium]|nr:ferulic acid esterase [Chloroflexota bacterium]